MVCERSVVREFCEGSRWTPPSRMVCAAVPRKWLNHGAPVHHDNPVEHVNWDPAAGPPPPPPPHQPIKSNDRSPARDKGLVYLGFFSCLLVFVGPMPVLDVQDSLRGQPQAFPR